MPKNEYLSFVSDEDFLECVEWVCDAYSRVSNTFDLDFLIKTSVDPFKMVFDMFGRDGGIKLWMEKEKMRQADKTVNNRIGDFHQKLLGKVDGWVDLGVGDKSEVDLKREDNSIFIELKNKYNTMNSSSTAQCRRKLENIVKEYPNATAYWAYIVPKKTGDYGNEPWAYSNKGDKHLNPQIRKVWGKSVYELVTGNPNALEETWKALPSAIGEVIDLEMQFNGQDKKLLVDFSKYIFD